MDSKRKMWRDRHPLMSAEHEPELEARAAIHELSNGHPRAAAEDKAYEDYLKTHIKRAAAHHLAGVKAAHAAGDPQAAAQHAVVYGLMARTLGFNPHGEPPEDIAALSHDSTATHVYDFKPHGADAVVMEHLRKLGEAKKGLKKADGDAGAPIFNMATFQEPQSHESRRYGGKHAGGGKNPYFNYDDHLPEQSRQAGFSGITIAHGGKMVTAHLNHGFGEIQAMRRPDGGYNVLHDRWTNIHPELAAKHPELLAQHKHVYKALVDHLTQHLGAPYVNHLLKPEMNVVKAEQPMGGRPIERDATGDTWDMSHVLPKLRRDQGEKLYVYEAGTQRVAHHFRDEGDRRIPTASFAEDEHGDVKPFEGHQASADIQQAAELAIRVRKLSALHNMMTKARAVSDMLTKARELEKGVVHRIARFNPQEMDEGEREDTRQWQVMAENRDDVPRLEGTGRVRALHKLSGLTHSRRNADGEREYLLHRGMSPDEYSSSTDHDTTDNDEQTPPNSVVSHGQMSSWSPNKGIADRFAADYNGRAVSAWVRESKIHSFPKQWGDVGGYGHKSYEGKPEGENKFEEEQEVIVAPQHDSDVAHPSEVMKVTHPEASLDGRINARGNLQIPGQAKRYAPYYGEKVAEAKQEVGRGVHPHIDKQPTAQLGLPKTNTPDTPMALGPKGSHKL